MEKAITNHRMNDKLNLSSKRGRQLTICRRYVEQAAKDLNVELVATGNKFGSYPKRRKSFRERTDYIEMLKFCKKNPDVKWIIIDNPVNFADLDFELWKFEDLFERFGIKFYYADDEVINETQNKAKRHELIGDRFFNNVPHRRPKLTV